MDEIAKRDRVAETSILVTPTSRREYLAKALTGQPGDKRNTKYAAATAGGVVAGQRLGQHAGAARAGGRKSVYRALNAESARRLAPYQDGGGNLSAALRAGIEPHHIVNATPGAARMVRGGTIGAAVGAAGAAGAYATHRHRQRGAIQKDAFGVEIIKDARDVGYRAGDATRRHDRALEAGSAAVSGGAAAGALRSARTARSARNEMTGAATVRDVAHSRVRERLQAHARKTGTTGHLGRTDAGMGLTARYANVGAHRAGAASDAATVARTATRRARGLSGLAVGAAATGVALHRREKPAPLTSHSYR